MPVDAQFDPPRRIAAHFDEQRTKVRILNVEVVVVHLDGFVARELELPIALLALKGLCFLLCYTDENEAVANATLLPNLVGDFALAFFVVELIHGDVLPLP